MAAPNICTVVHHVSLDDILNNTPVGLVAMFRVMSISSDIDDWVLEESVYVQDGKVYDFLTDTDRGAVEHFSLRFVKYITA